MIQWLSEFVTAIIFTHHISVAFQRNFPIHTSHFCGFPPLPPTFTGSLRAMSSNALTRFGSRLSDSCYTFHPKIASSHKVRNPGGEACPQIMHSQCLLLVHQESAYWNPFSNSYNISGILMLMGPNTDTTTFYRLLFERLFYRHTITVHLSHNRNSTNGT